VEKLKRERDEAKQELEQMRRELEAARPNPDARPNSGEFKETVPVFHFPSNGLVERKEKAKVQRSAAPGGKKEVDAPFTLALDMNFAAEEAEYEGGGDIAYEGGGDIEEYKGDGHTGDQDHDPEVNDTGQVEIVRFLSKSHRFPCQLSKCS